MRLLLASTALVPLAVMISGPAHAETVVSTATTTPLVTSSAGDVHITTAGSIKPASGAAVTIDSSSKVRNEGAIAIRGANGATGILANPGLAGDITNSGSITIDEDYTPVDSDKDGDLDGPFAQGNNRFGIRIVPGGSYTGTILNSGTITIEGNQSAGIAVDSALTGSLIHTGKISLLGDDSAGIRAGAVSGNVTIGSGSSIAVQGGNSVGVLLGGDIGGALVVQGSISSTGYRSTSVPADPSKLDSDDLLQGGSALVIGGSVAHGILLDTRPAPNGSTDTDIDKDGIPDAQETTATIATYGSAPAMAIGSATGDISIGAVASSSAGHGLVIKGTVSGSGAYSGVSATGLSIGGTGHNVTIAGGMTVSGSVSASASGASATAIHIGAGAAVPEIAVDGTVSATGSGTGASAAQAILIDSGASVRSILNSGTISATRSGSTGSAAAIVDRSGTLRLIENSGSIGVHGAEAPGDSGVAIDLRSVTSGAVVRQVAAATGKPAPEIDGTILFGSGNDSLDIEAGTVAGKVDFGGGADAMTLSGSSIFRGTLAGSSNLAVTIGSGATLDLTNAGEVDIGSLDAGAGSTIGVIIGQNGHTLYNVAGAASFGAGSKIQVMLDRVGTANGSYTILDAASLSGAGNVSAVNLPFLFNGVLIQDLSAGSLSLKIERKSASELGLNASESAIYGAALAAADADRPVAATFLAATDGKAIRDTLQHLMPDHAGGAFETATRGSRLVADILADPRPVAGLWGQQVAWGSTKSIGDTSSYKLSGWGAALGYDISLGAFGRVGLMADYLWGRDSHLSTELGSNHYEGGVYWRGEFGGFHAFARGALGTINFDSDRSFALPGETQGASRRAHGSWKGTLYSGTGGFAYEAHAGRISIRPSASLEYYRLKEGGYQETGGGDAVDLTVRGRSSNETAANGLLTLGYELMGADPDSGWARIELEGGRRQILSGRLGDTVASFKGGTPFTLAAEERTSGWRGAVRATGGGPGLSFVAEINAEEQQDHVAVGARAGLTLGL